MGHGDFHGNLSRDQLLLVDTNVSVRGEYQVAGVANVQVRVNLPLVRTARQGTVEKIQITATAKSGTQPSTLDTYILDTDGGSAAIDGTNVLYASVGDTVTAAVPQNVVNDVRPEPIPFVTKGTDGFIQAVLLHTGADGTTSYTYRIQVYGKVLG